MYLSARERNLTSAFDILDCSNAEVAGYITQDQMSKVFVELNNYHKIKKIDKDVEPVLFQLLDEDGTRRISREEFNKLCIVLDTEVRKVAKTPWFKRRFPEVAATETFRVAERMVGSRWFEIFVDFVLILNLCVTILETLGNIEGDSEPQQGQVWVHTEFAFCAFFTSEMLMKLAVLGEGYWASIRNRFDGLVTMATVIVTIIVMYPNALNNKTAIHFVLVFRVLRVLRLLASVPGFRVLMTTLGNILRNAKGLVLAMGVIVYIFAYLGMELFGGVINTDPHSKYSGPVRESDYFRANYTPNNFNDLPSAMVTLFEVLVVNNWFLIVEGFEKACGYGARFYFLAFYFLGVILFLNVISSFVLETFLDAWQETKSKGGSLELEQDDDIVASTPKYDFVRSSKSKPRFFI